RRARQLARRDCHFNPFAANGEIYSCRTENGQKLIPATFRERPKNNFRIKVGWAVPTKRRVHGFLSRLRCLVGTAHPTIDRPLRNLLLSRPLPCTVGNETFIVIGAAARSNYSAKFYLF